MTTSVAFFPELRSTVRVLPAPETKMATYLLSTGGGGESDFATYLLSTGVGGESDFATYLLSQSTRIELRRSGKNATLGFPRLL